MGQQTSAAAYVVASSDIVSESFEGEFVVLDLSSGRYYSMDAAASALWRALSAGIAVTDIAAATEGAPAVDAQGVSDFAEKLVAYGCLTPSDTPSSATIDPSIIEALKASAAPPNVELFDDLADLIMADPIHDVEETAGWPVRKPIAAE